MGVRVEFNEEDLLPNYKRDWLQNDEYYKFLTKSCTSKLPVQFTIYLDHVKDIIESSFGTKIIKPH
jgi:hypothetical protein